MSNLVDYTDRLQAIGKALEKAKTDRTRAETTKESLEKQRDGIIEELRALGVEPDKLDDTITELDEQIRVDLASLEQMIPAEYRV